MLIKLTKFCTKCKLVKEVNSFYRNKTSKDGLQSWCISCWSLTQAKYRKTEQRKIVQQRYCNSTRGKQKRQEYAKSIVGKIVHQQANKKYYYSEKGRLTQKLWKPSRISQEKRKLYLKQYNQTAHGKVVNQAKRMRYLEKKMSLDSRFTSKNRQTTLDIFNNKCFNCDCKINLEIDHHYSLNRGFGLSLGNAVLLCRSCNAQKGNKLPQTFYIPEKYEKLEYLLSLLECQDLGVY